MSALPMAMDPSQTGNMGANVNNQDALYDRLMDMGYTEEEIESILALASLEGESEILGDQMDYANELRKTETAEGLNPTGRVYTAANPLQHLGVGMKRYQGENEARDIEERQMQIMDDQMRARLDYLRRGNKPNADATIAQAQQPITKPIRPGRGVLYT